MLSSKSICMWTLNRMSHDLSELLELALRNAGYSNERIIHYSFLVENALHEWRTRLPPDAELVYERKDTSKNVEFTVELTGERCDPFDVTTVQTASAATPSSTSGSSELLDRLLSGVGNEIRYSYRHGTNRIRIRLPKHDVDDTIFRRNLLVLLAPLAVEYLLETVASSVDALMLSFSDSFAMSAVTMVMVFMQFQGYVVFACIAATAALVSQYWGIRDRASIGKVASIALKATMLVSVFFGGAALTCPETIMGLYTNVPEIVARGTPYLRLIGFYFLLSPLYRIYFCCIRAVGRPKASMAYTIVGCTVNIVLNAIFIYGLFGAPKLGIVGVGIATLTSTLVQVGLSVADYLRHREFSLTWRNAPLVGSPLSRKFFGNVIPTISQCMSWILGSNIVTAVIGHMHADIVAANSLLLLVFTMVISMQQGYGSAVGLLIGNLLGRGRLDAAKHYGSVALRFAFRLGLGFAAVCLALGYLLPLLPLDLNANATRIVRLLVPAFCLNALFGVPNSAIAQGLLYTGGDAKGLLIVDSIFMWGFLVPFALLSAYVFHMPELALIAIARNEETISFPLKMVRYRAFKWLKNLTKTGN